MNPKVVKPFSRLWANTLPPWDSTICLTMYSPRPVLVLTDFRADLSLYLSKTVLRMFFGKNREKPLTEMVRRLSLMSAEILTTERGLPQATALETRLPTARLS